MRPLVELECQPCREARIATIEAMAREHRVEMAKLRVQLAVYRQELLNHGIDPPDRDGDDLLKMLRDANAVISTASDFVAQLGSAKELIGDFGGAVVHESPGVVRLWIGD